MNWEPQHLPWKVTEPQIDGPASPDTPTPRVLDASLALPKSGFNLPLPPWQNVRRADGILELRTPGQRREIPEPLKYENVAVAHFNEDTSPADIPDDPDDWLRRDKGAEKTYRTWLKQIDREASLWKPKKDRLVTPKEDTARECVIKNSPGFEAWKLEMTRRHRILSLGALSMSDERGKDFFNIYKKSTEYRHPAGVWDVYPDQISEPSNSQELWLEDKKVYRAYQELISDTANSGQKTPSNYEPWHWWLIMLRAPIAKRTGIPTKNVDRALCRLTKKWLKRESRIKGDWSQVFSAVDVWQHDLALTKRDEFFWMKHIQPRMNTAPVPYR
jgi:hypothetical protein